MAREALPIAGAIVGAAIGSMFGNPMLGAQLGFMVGGIASAVLFPPDPIQGPKLEDRRVQTSSYGLPKAYCYGTTKCSGIIIWAPDLDEDTEEQGGGKGGTPGIEVSTYYFNGAILICKGPIEAVTRIWADDELIYDRRSSNEGAALLPGLRFRLYLGNGDQDPDPLIQEREGVDATPAWPNDAYIVVEEFPVGRYGNRVPNFLFEVVATFTEAYPVVSVGRDIGLDPGVFGPTGGTIMYDPVALHVVISGDVAQRIDTLTNTVINEVSNPIGSGINRGNPVMQPDGRYYYQEYQPGSVQTFHPVYKIDAWTFEVIDSIGSAGSVSGAPNSCHMQMHVIPGGVNPEGVQIDWYMGTAGDDGYLYVWDCEPFIEVSLIDLSDYQADIGLSGFWYTISSCAITPDLFLWTVVGTDLQSPNITKVVKFRIDRTQASIDGNAEVVATYDISAYVGYQATAVIYDPGSNSLLILTDDVGGDPPSDYILKFSLDSLTVEGVYPPYLGAEELSLGTVAHPGPWQQGPVYGEFWVMDGGGDIHRIRVSDMSRIELIEYTNYTSLDPRSGPIYDPVCDAIWTNFNADTEVKKLLLHRGDGGTTTLRAIMTDVADKCGYDVTGAPSAASPDINVTAQTQVVRGFSWSLAPARNTLQQLLDWFAVDWIEQDGLLKGVNRGAASVATLDDDDDFGAHVPGGGVPLEAIREPSRIEDEELSLPLSLTVNYQDVDDDYAVGSQVARRVAEAVDAVSDTVEAYAIVASADEAAQVAERRLWQRWVGRWKYAGTVHWGWLRLNASDPVTVTDNDDSVRVRLTSVEIGDNLLMKLRGDVEDSTALYTSTAVGGTTTGSGAQPATIQIPGGAVLVLMDTLPLREVDDTFGFYYAVGSYRDLDEWGGAVVRRSTDGLSYLTFDTVGTEAGAIVGIAQNALGAPYSAFCWDRDNTLTVFVHNGTLSSATEDEVLAGANWAWIGGEIVGFATATDNGNGTYTLSTFLRARRHTDDKTDTHVIGEDFVLLTLASTRLAVTDSDEQNLTRYYKANSLGWLANEPAVAFANTGRRLKPPRVHDIRADRSGSPSGLTLTWIRRDRLSWNRLIGAVANSEATESYEIDVMMPGSPDTVARTLTSTSPTVFYSDAQQLTDFGSIPATVTVRIYQMNAIIGRGIAAEATL